MKPPKKPQPMTANSDKEHSKKRKLSEKGNNETPVNSKERGGVTTGKGNDPKKGQGVSEDAFKMPPPPEYKQKVLIGLLRANLDVVNVHKLGKSVDRLAQVRHFIERSAPMGNMRDWVLIKSAVDTEISIMREFVRQYDKIKNQL